MCVFTVEGLRKRVRAISGPEWPAQHGLPAADREDGVDDAVRVDRLREHRGRAVAPGAPHVLGLQEPPEQHDPRRQPLAPDRRQDRDPVELGHAQVEHRDVRPARADLLQGLLSVGRLAVEPDPGVVLERPHEAGPEQRMVVGDDHAQHRSPSWPIGVAFAGMCRNIRPLHNFEPPATEDEVHDAALQYVRKISGSTKPSKANEAVFERAVEEITAASRRLLDGLVTSAPPKDREAEAAKARARSAKRFAA
jgi:hypothetical protein